MEPGAFGWTCLASPGAHSNRSKKGGVKQAIAVLSKKRVAFTSPATHIQDKQTLSCLVPIPKGTARLISCGLQSKCDLCLYLCQKASVHSASKGDHSQEGISRVSHSQRNPGFNTLFFNATCIENQTTHDDSTKTDWIVRFPHSPMPWKSWLDRSWPGNANERVETM